MPKCVKCSKETIFTLCIECNPLPKENPLQEVKWIPADSEEYEYHREYGFDIDQQLPTLPQVWVTTLPITGKYLRSGSTLPKLPTKE